MASKLQVIGPARGARAREITFMPLSAGKP
jgi:hypothetical protein